jgi:Catalytic LigB subunit of aromatic ring-opening dioxygenase
VAVRDQAAGPSKEAPVAQLVGVLNTAHTPFCYMDVETWELVRERRASLRSDVPLDSHEESVAKRARVEEGFAALREKLTELRPDVLVIFGDDQEEVFDFTNHPAIAVFVGESFAGRVTAGDTMLGTRPADPSIPHAVVPGHPGLGVSILTGLLDRGFDPAFMMEVPENERGMGHAIMRPLESITDFNIPTVPILLNAYYAPQLTATRCYEIGRAVREVIDSYPEELRVVIVGSGGMWHTPGQAGSWLDENFDRQGLEYLEKGQIKDWAAAFDAYQVPDGDTSQDVSTPRRGITGLPTPGGPQGGTRETCNWIAAAAAIEGVGSTVIDYIPIYASPVGAAFAWATL